MLVQNLNRSKVKCKLDIQKEFILRIQGGFNIKKSIYIINISTREN